MQYIKEQNKRQNCNSKVINKIIKNKNKNISKRECNKLLKTSEDFILQVSNCDELLETGTDYVKKAFREEYPLLKDYTIAGQQIKLDTELSEADRIFNEAYKRQQQSKQ